ncbi:MAG: ligand-gated ion channel, partial [Planctomycetota bacterium]
MSVGGCLALILPIVLAATAAGQTDPVESPASTSNALGFISHERPNAQSGPTRVTIALYIVDVARIDDVDLTSTVDFHLRVEWSDPRLASEAGGVRVLDVDEIWTPTPQVANERRLFRTFDEVVSVDPAGHVMYRQRFHGTITTPLDLRNFPLDRNTVRFRVVAAGYGPEEVEFVIDERITGQRHPLSLIDFRVADGTARLGT